MGSVWTYRYGDNTIIIKNEKATELYVNGELQDRKTGISLSADLTGELKSGEKIKASLGGGLSVKCSLFVDNILQEPVEIK